MPRTLGSGNAFAKQKCVRAIESARARCRPCGAAEPVLRKMPCIVDTCRRDVHVHTWSMYKAARMSPCTLQTSCRWAPTHTRSIGVAAHARFECGVDAEWGRGRFIARAPSVPSRSRHHPCQTPRSCQASTDVAGKIGRGSARTSAAPKRVTSAPQPASDRPPLTRNGCGHRCTRTYACHTDFLATREGLCPVSFCDVSNELPCPMKAL